MRTWTSLNNILWEKTNNSDNLYYTREKEKHKMNKTHSTSVTYCSFYYSSLFDIPYFWIFLLHFLLLFSYFLFFFSSINWCSRYIFIDSYLINIFLYWSFFLVFVVLVVVLNCFFFCLFCFVFPFYFLFDFFSFNFYCFTFFSFIIILFLCSFFFF